MKQKKDTPKPLIAIKNLTHNFPDIWKKIDPADYNTAVDFCSDNDRLDSKYIMFAFAKWRLSKQIFEIDEELCNTLMENDKIDDELPTEIVDRLIYDCFYVKLPEEYIRVSLAGNPSVKNSKFLIDGFFYYIYDRTAMFVILFSSGHTQSMGFKMHEGLTLKENIEKSMKVSPDVYKLINFFVQIILYLCADNADVEENYVQKQVYKPSAASNIKDTYTELRKWDVGYRYGKAIKRAKQAEQNGTQKENSEHHEGSHSRKRTHVRRGHLHHFWRGSEKDGTRELIVKWVSSTVINAEFENIVTIRKVKM